VEPGLPLVIQRSDNLRLWDDWYTVVPNTNRLEVVDPSALASASQFYRIQIR